MMHNSSFLQLRYFNLIVIFLFFIGYLFTWNAFANSLFFQNLGAGQAGSFNIVNTGIPHTATRTAMTFYSDPDCGTFACNRTITSGSGFPFLPGATVHISSAGVYSFANGAGSCGTISALQSVSILPYYNAGSFQPVFTAAACFNINCTIGSDCTGTETKSVTLS